MRKAKVNLTGHWKVEAFDPATGKTLWTERVGNAATLAGTTHMLQTEFNAGSQVTAWYMGVIANAGYTGLSEDDTMAAHAGWAEDTGYAAATRPQWTPLACAAGIIVNSSEVVMVAASAMVLVGLFITSSPTKGGATGTLFSTGLFSTTRTLAAGNGLRLTYDVVMTGSGS